MVKLIDETTHYYKTKCQHCESYLMFEREDEFCTTEGRRKIWWVECPNCKKSTPSCEFNAGKLIDYQIK